MATAPPDRLLTAEEFGALPDDGHRYELVLGKIIELPPEYFSPGIVAATITILVGAYVRQHKLGICGSEGGGVRTRSNPDSVRAPDFSFISRDRLPPGGMPRRHYPPSPDLAVEVMSPSDRITVLIDKAYEYLDDGARLVWLVLPDERAVMVFRPGQRPRTATGDARLDGEDVLPGFSVPLPELWEGLADAH